MLGSFPYRLEWVRMNFGVLLACVGLRNLVAISFLIVYYMMEMNAIKMYGKQGLLEHFVVCLSF